ncbi:hypothetical protein IWX90DRAFT_423212 [Phyllosticta citrichinensis]|uniref:Secreted protein n=1 Tax=Phyllosticta citrichinensis TaxID=1130410 RepID=A0ABR1Y1M9_9PEZI
MLAACWPGIRALLFPTSACVYPPSAHGVGVELMPHRTSFSQPTALSRHVVARFNVWRKGCRVVDVSRHLEPVSDVVFPTFWKPVR